MPPASKEVESSEEDQVVKKSSKLTKRSPDSKEDSQVKKRSSTLTKKPPKTKESTTFEESSERRVRRDSGREMDRSAKGRDYSERRGSFSTTATSGSASKGKEKEREAGPSRSVRRSDGKGSGWKKDSSSRGDDFTDRIAERVDKFCDDSISRPLAVAVAHTAIHVARHIGSGPEKKLAEKARKVLDTGADGERKRKGKNTGKD